MRVFSLFWSLPDINPYQGSKEKLERGIGAFLAQKKGGKVKTTAVSPPFPTQKPNSNGRVDK
tara:strand:+ start:664 stop:849 length:186 start_codon:yes stop_codon:yes gene_type:complete